MDDLFTPVSTTFRSAGKTEKVVQETKTRRPETPTTPEDALETLRHEPDYELLASTLKFLRSSEPSGFDIRAPGPLSARLVHILVSEIVPNYWAVLREDSKGKGSCLEHLLWCLRSVTGVNAVLARIKAIIQEARSESREKGKKQDFSLDLSIILELLHNVIHDNRSVLDTWNTAAAGLDTRALRPLIPELLAIFGGGRIVSLAAEAISLLDADPETGKGTREYVWLGNSLRYTRWLGENIIQGKLAPETAEQNKFFSGLLGKGLHLGHAETLTKDVFSGLLLRKGVDHQRFGTLLDNLSQTEQRKVLFSIFKILADSHLNRLGNCGVGGTDAMISAVAGAVNAIIDGSKTRKAYMLEWLTSSSGAGIGDGVGIRRAVLAVTAQQKDDVADVVEKIIRQFGDELYIKHSPMLQQEAHTQVLLLSAGYVQRNSPFKLAMLLKTGAWMNAISNRLAAPHQRARLLGMVAGESLSALVDKAETRLNFKMDETNEGELKWYKGLVTVSDTVGNMDILVRPQAEILTPKNPTPIVPSKRPAPQQPKTGFIIEELSDEESEDDIVPYVKPESDEEDSDEDPTLVRRDKPKAPVYIRDLIRYLRDTESYDHQKLALTTAPTLIRRKANYGSEVAEHADELATLLVGLNDKFEIDNFDNLKLQSMMAIVVAQPQAMGTWFAKTFFDGDFSVSQRASVLVVLGLSARELAGRESSEYAKAASFPSKTLPEQVERLYLGSGPSTAQLTPASRLKPLPPNALDHISHSLIADILTPMAAIAADAATGPDVLKLSTFTSRLNDPKIKIKSRPRAQVRAIPNTTASLLSTSFFAPLTARFQAALHSSASRTRGIVFQPYLLALFIKTLAVIIKAAGPSTLALPEMVAEFWGLLLSTSVRAQAVGDLNVTQALLFGLLTLLDVNENRMRDVCRDMGREVVETQEWVAGIFAGLKGGDKGEEEEVKMLAAGVLVRLNEGVEKYRLLMIGDLIG
ncbi:hypothetical protein OQA88_1653 [Cercophora sp. LCS_1]